MTPEQSAEARLGSLGLRSSRDWSSFLTCEKQVMRVEE
jgi:hypothetical protein